MMQLLVTGKNGQVSTALQRLSGQTAQVVAVGRPEVDICDAAAVEAAILRIRPDIIVNAAAYTAVDRAEDEPDLAYAVNAAGAGNVARASAALSIPVIHLSTDYVFSGSKDGPYVEDDETGPLGVYGRTKLEGELAVARNNPRHVILRTAWVYSAHGQNFLKTMLRLAGERDTLKVVADQHGNPTQADEIARAVLSIATRPAAPDGSSRYGVFHLAGRGETTWAGFAQAILAESAARGGPSAKVVPIAAVDYPTKARRPANSRLDTTRLREAFGVEMRDWREAMAETVSTLVGSESVMRDLGLHPQHFDRPATG